MSCLFSLFLIFFFFFFVPYIWLKYVWLILLFHINSTLFILCLNKPLDQTPSKTERKLSLKEMMQLTSHPTPLETTVVGLRKWSHCKSIRLNNWELQTKSRKPFSVLEAKNKFNHTRCSGRLLCTRFRWLMQSRRFVEFESPFWLVLMANQLTSVSLCILETISFLCVFKYL